MIVRVLLNCGEKLVHVHVVVVYTSTYLFSVFHPPEHFIRIVLVESRRHRKRADLVDAHSRWPYVERRGMNIVDILTMHWQHELRPTFRMRDVIVRW